MANQKLLELLKQGVEVWNQWRTENAELKIDFIGVDLSNVNLVGANFVDIDLSYANFNGANLNKAILDRASLTGANFNRANLSDAKFIGAFLFNAYFSGANFSGANFSNADLNRTNLINTELSNVNFSNANFRNANLNRADLSRINLSGTDLSEADLSRANLRRSDLSRANLRKANLRATNLSEADLRDADFREACLIDATFHATQALSTNFTGANLTGVCIQDWNINSRTTINDVICEYIYLNHVWSYQQEKYCLDDRRPSDPNRIFAPGEFQAFVQKALSTVDLIFADGIDWQAFFQSFQELRSEYEDLSIQAIEKKSGGAFVIRLEVPTEANKAEIESQAKELYERERQLLEARYQALLQGKDEQIAVYKEWLNSERQRNTGLTGIVKTMADKETSKVTQHFNAPVTGVAGNVEGNQIIYSPEQRQTLAEAAKEIQHLLNQLSVTYPTATSVGQMEIATKAVEEIEKNPALKQRVIGALKAGGTEALKELVDHPAVNILLAVLEGWQKP